MEFILQPWPWYVSGFLISIVLFLLFYFGKNFGISSNLETMCTIAGAGKISDYFNTNWKDKTWSLIFLIGLIIGGYVTVEYLSKDTSIDISLETIKDLNELGFNDIGTTFVPSEIFSIERLLTLKGFLILFFAGVLIGFGTRYADGCTSGHAITGLSSFQLPSLIAVIGFFIGGLFMVWLVFPLIFN
ncbi:YeeE/YedE thiosulfate transporter family protein [uncultured Tenacibaculum sp.]|uniref:YeeE/YedE family protein n=1 Tax=uncultured Tenacibaculum sp. TaxID=174713 RepID=UPI003445B339